MIRFYSGTPGSGKSYHVACDILDWILAGKRVIANFPIDGSYFKRYPRGEFYYCSNCDLTVKSLKDFSRLFHEPFKERQTLLVIDECGILFNPRAWKDADRMGWLAFFSQHRKLGYEIILVSQADIMVDKQIRSQIEEEHKHRAVKNYKFFGWLVDKLFGGLFLDITYWYPCKLKIGSHFLKFQLRKARIYDTFKIFE